MVRKRFETNKFHMNLRLALSKKHYHSSRGDYIQYSHLASCSPTSWRGEVCMSCMVYDDSDPRFVTTHSRRLSLNNVLMYSHEITPTARFHCYYPLDVTDSDVKVSDFKFLILSEVVYLSNCNGLILTRAQNIYYVGNPITRRILRLPEFSSMLLHHDSAVLAFEASSKVFKVVMSFTDTRSRLKEYAILTVGVDKAWRSLIPLTQMSRPGSFFGIKSQIPVPGFIYYVSSWDTYDIYGLDLKSETMKSITTPYVRDPLVSFDVRPKGDSISIWYRNPDFSLEVWVLKDYKTGEWVKILYIEGEPIRNERENLLSRNRLKRVKNPHRLFRGESWLGNDEKILFSIIRFGLDRFSDDSPINSSPTYNLFMFYDLNLF